MCYRTSIVFNLKVFLYNNNESNLPLKYTQKKFLMTDSFYKTSDYMKLRYILSGVPINFLFFFQEYNIISCALNVIF